MNKACQKPVRAGRQRGAGAHVLGDPLLANHVLGDHRRAAISAAVTLSLIDYPLGVAWDELVKLVGVSKGRYAYYHFELVHSVEGHEVPLPLRVTWGLFHLRESLWPGLGTPLFALGLIGLAAPLVAARERRMPLLLIAGFTVLWYATPLKPFPDFFALHAASRAALRHPQHLVHLRALVAL